MTNKKLELLLSFLIVLMATNPTVLFSMDQINHRHSQNKIDFNNTQKDEISERDDVDQIDTPRTSAVSWWNNSFHYRRIIEITNPYPQALPNYPAKITFDYNGLVSTGKMRSDLKDIRIVENGILRNYYYKKDFPSSGEATVWFETDILVSRTEIDVYLYYGNLTVGKAESYFIDERFGDAWYRFEEGNGSSAYDSSDNSNHGTLGSVPNDPNWDPSAKVENYCLNFSRTDYVQIIDSPSLSPRYEVSISFWVNLTSGSQSGIRKDFADYLFEFGTNGGNNPGTNPQFLVETISGWHYIYGSGAYSVLNLNQWYHCVGTYNYQTGAKMYINGQQATVITSSNLGIIRGSNSYLNLGYWAGEVFYGKMDDVKIFNRSLSNEDISWEYNLGFPLSISLRAQVEVGGTFLDWIDVGTYKEFSLYTPKMRFNPSKSDYIVVISPLLAQAGKIESCKLEGMDDDEIESLLHAYRNQTEDAIIATLEAHPDAYIYIMDNDLGHIYNEFLLKYDLYDLHIYTFINKEMVPISLDEILGNIFPLRFFKVWIKYRALIQQEMLNIRKSQTSHVNVLILGNSLEFPEYLKVSYPDSDWRSKFGRPKYFSDISYMLRENKLLGGIGRISIEQSSIYFQKIKEVSFQKKYHIAGSDMVNPDDNIDDLIEMKAIFDQKGGYSSTFVIYNDFVTYLEMADFIVSGFHGLSFKGPKFGVDPAYKVEFNPSLFIAYSCDISNSILYNNKKIYNVYSDVVNKKGVTLFGNTLSGYINFRKNTFDSRDLVKEIIKEILNGKLSTIGEIQSYIAGNYLNDWFALEMRISGDPGLNITPFDDPFEENVNSLPNSFTSNFSLDFDVESTSIGELLIIDISNSESSINSMKNCTITQPVRGGELLIPSLEYYLDIPLNQTIDELNLKLSDNISISVPNPSEDQGYLMTENGAVAIPNVNLNNETLYPRLITKCFELPWKKIYKVQVFPALYNDSGSEFVLSKNITLQFKVVNTSLVSNASLNYNPIEFNPYIKACENNTLYFELINTIKSVENATSVNATLNLPSDLVINDSNGNIQGNAIKWEFDQIELSEYLYADYKTPTSIVTNKKENITIFIEYLSKGGSKYNEFNLTLQLYYLIDGFCNLKLDNILLVTELIQGQELNLHYDVKNTGEIKISYVPVQIFLSDMLINSTTINLLNSKEKISIDFSKVINTPGTYDLTIKILSISVESNLTDNEFTIQLTIIGLGLPLEEEEDEKKEEEGKESILLILALIITGVSLGIVSIVIVAKRELVKEVLKKIMRNNKSKK